MLGARPDGQNLFSEFSRVGTGLSSKSPQRDAPRGMACVPPLAVMASRTTSPVISLRTLIHCKPTRSFNTKPRVRNVVASISVEAQSLFEVANALDVYESALAWQPLLTKCVTSGVGFAVADVVAQSLSGGWTDKKRTLFNTVFGLLLYGPTSSAWYGALDEFIFPGDSDNAIAVFTKTAADQILWAPVLITSLFAWDLKVNSNEPLFGHGNNLQTKLKNDLLTTLKVNWGFWPAFHLLNFRFVAPADRILYINVVQVIYNVFLVVKAAERKGQGDDRGIEGEKADSSDDL